MRVALGPRSRPSTHYGAVVHLTADDRLDIMELPARYADALDRLEPERLRGVFTTDAIWEVTDGHFRLEGLTDIMEFMGRTGVHPGSHILTNMFIESVTADPRDGGPLVRLWSRGLYPVGPSDRRDPTGVFYGSYDDDVVRTEDGWRIRHRRYRHGS
jgi:hypothetical protein